MRSLPLYTAMFVCVSVSQLGLDKTCRGCVDNAEARVAPGSTVQVYSSWWTVYLCSFTTGPSKVCVLNMCTHCLLPHCGDFLSRETTSDAEKFPLVSRWGWAEGLLLFWLFNGASLNIYLRFQTLEVTSDSLINVQEPRTIPSERNGMRVMVAMDMLHSPLM